MEYKDLKGGSVTEKIKIFNCDNLELLRQTPDNYYDLAITDPPYGISINANMGRAKGKRKRHKDVSWDDEIPSDEYWAEVFRTSKNQIVWGGNYFPQIWANGCKHFLFWDKLVPDGMSFSSGELAWTSFNQADKKVVLRNITNDKIHPTQKPPALYKYCLDKYAKPDFKILDTHLGSGSIAIACHDYGFELTACELDKDYYDAAIKRIKNHVGQQKLF